MRQIFMALTALVFGQGCVGVVGLGEANYLIQQIALVSPSEAKQMGIVLISHQCVVQINEDCVSWHKKGAGPGDIPGWTFTARAQRGPYSLKPEFVIAGEASCQQYQRLFKARAPKDYQVSECAGPVWYQRG